MTLVSLDNAGRFGLVQDPKVDSIPVEAWNRLSNIRCRHGALQGIGNDFNIYVNGTEAPRFFFNLRNPTDPHWISCANDRVYKVNGGANTDITKVGATYSGIASSVWSGIDFHRHQIVNVNNGIDYPQALLPGASNLVDLPNWPVNTFCKYMNAYKNFLIGFGITKAGVLHSNRIKWSDIADTGQLPYSWDETNLTTLAGETDELERGGGQILAAKILNDINYVYKDNSIWMMYPRNDLRVFNFKEMNVEQGLLAPYALCAMYKKHYLMVSGDVVYNDGQRLTSIISGTNRKWLFDNLHGTHFSKTVLVPNYRDKELWICFPDLDSTGYLNQALIYNIETFSWSRRRLDNFSYLASGLVDSSMVSQIIDDDLGVIDLDDSIIDAVDYNPTFERILAGDVMNGTYWQMDTESHGYMDGGSWERHGLTITGRDRFNEWKFGANVSKLVTRIYPKFTGKGRFNVWIGRSKVPEGQITWAGPEIYTIGEMPHLDFIVAGEAIALRFEALDPYAWTYSGCDMELSVIAENTF